MSEQKQVLGIHSAAQSHVEEAQAQEIPQCE